MLTESALRAGESTTATAITFCAVEGPALCTVTLQLTTLPTLPLIGHDKLTEMSAFVARTEEIATVNGPALAAPTLLEAVTV